MIFSPEQVHTIKQRALDASARYDVAVMLDNNFCENAAGLRHIEFAAALGVEDECLLSHGAFDALADFCGRHAGRYIFSWLSYDLKNELENLSSTHDDGIGFAPGYAFVPQLLLVIDADGRCLEGEAWALRLLNETAPAQHVLTAGKLEMQPRVSREQYVKDVESIRSHIVDGDVYELNYCTEFFAERVEINPQQVYRQLIAKSPVPFAAFVKWNERYLMCASPERFIMRKGQRVYSQPIKGTAPRGLTAQDDLIYRQQLLDSEKERAENLMIVDLVRNDLARTARTGTVTVDELFGIYRFPQVHQMISTVSAEPEEGTGNADVIRHAFPMGSMTGAPKIMAMELIEKYERTRRGLYSGAVGYFAPGGHFDLNVVIRSLQYNQQSGYLSFEVGSAITYDSVALEEYGECMLKARAMMEVLKEMGGEEQ